MKKSTNIIAGFFLLFATSAFTVKTDNGSLIEKDKLNKNEKGVVAPVEERSQAIELPKVLVLEEDKVFTQVEIDASFNQKGGWAGFIRSAIESNMDELVAEGRSITLKVSFMVSKDGSLTNVQALNMKDSKLARIALEAIKNAPKWTPAQQNGHYVNVYREQEISFII